MNDSAYGLLHSSNEYSEHRVAPPEGTELAEAELIASIEDVFAGDGDA